MIIVRAPTRVSFCGGGSDLPAFYSKHGGAVLSTGLNRYVYLSIHPNFYPDKIKCKYAKNELVDKPSELVHPIFRVLLEKFDLNGVEITSNADVPAGTGLGTSSSFTVALLHTLYAYIGKYVSPERLATEACYTEIEKLGEPIGKQDQYAAAYGGLNLYRFNKDGSVDVEPVILPPESTERIESNLMMFYTGDVRSASELLSEQSSNIQTDSEIENAQLEIFKLTDELHKELINNNIDSLGDIMNASWEQKRKLAHAISNPAIDKAYNDALSAGASGGKLLGAGGGGFLLFYVSQNHQNAVKNALKNLRFMEFGFSRSGSTVIYVGDKPNDSYYR